MPVASAARPTRERERRKDARRRSSATLHKRIFEHSARSERIVARSGRPIRQAPNPLTSGKQRRKDPPTHTSTGAFKRRLPMKKALPVLVIAIAVVALLAAAPADRSKTYNVTADTIEGCSCPLFCSCYFGPSADEHMCEFNNVYKFRKGSHYGDVDLSDQVVWVSGDLGGEWHKKPGPGMPTKW